MKRYIPALAALVLGLLFTYIAYQRVQEHHMELLEGSFIQMATHQVHTVESRMAEKVSLLRALVGFYQGSKFVDRGEFKTFVQTVLAREPDFQAMEWVPRVLQAERARFEQQAKDDGFADFNIREKQADGKRGIAGQRDEYFPIYYIEPYVGNEEVLGFDLASIPESLSALEEARDRGKVVASGRVNLIRLKDNNAGVLIFAPVYKKDRQLDGFALAVVRISSLLSGFKETLDSVPMGGGIRIDHYLFDESAPKGEQLLLAHLEEQVSGIEIMDLERARTGTHVSHSFEVGGRTWTVVARPSGVDHVGMSLEAAMALMVSLFGVLVFVIYLVSMARQGKEIEALVRIRTRELEGATRSAEESKARTKAILENTADGIITIDAKGAIQAVNRAAEQMFGYEPKELHGRNIALLVPPDEREAHNNYVLNSRLHSSRIINKARDLEGYRKDGSMFPMELNVSSMEHEGQRMFIGIVRDITDRKQAETLKREFVSTVSHELRTPLTSIKGSLGLIRSGKLGELPEQLQSLLDIAYNNSNRLVLLINDILDIEKLAAGQVVFHMRPLNLLSLLQQGLEDNRGFAKEYNVSFELTEVEDAEALVDGDSDRLMQVLANLLSNAAKFSPPGGRVELSIRRHGKAHRVTVRDHGPGIPEEFRRKMFERFTQADSSDSRQKGGTGLGLSIAKSIIEKHGGSIGFETELDQGTSFYFDLPARSKTEFIQCGAHLEEAEHRILICEDEPDVAQMLRQMLVLAGYEADIAMTALDAKSMLAEDNYAAMTLDLMLPDQDGISLMRELRAMDATKDLPIIVVSAMAAEGCHELNGSAIGVIDWIDKPIDPERLSYALCRAIGARSEESVKPRVLHVEDDLDVVQVVAALIGDFATVSSSMTLADARRMLEQEEFDLVILDMILPDGSGEDLLPLMKGEDGEQTPVIIFSARDVSREMAHQIKQVLVKSQTTNEALLDAVHKAVRTRSHQCRKKETGSEGQEADHAASESPGV